MQTLAVQIPVELPSAERIEEIIREAAAAAAREQMSWLTFEEAAKHWGVSFRTFERKKKKLGLPVSEIDGVKRIARADLDAALRAHLKVPKVRVLEFPSLVQRDAERKAGAA